MCMLMAHLGASQANQRDWEVCSSANGWTHDFTVPNAIRLLLGSDIQKVSSESLPPPLPLPVGVCVWAISLPSLSLHAGFLLIHWLDPFEPFCEPRKTEPIQRRPMPLMSRRFHVGGWRDFFSTELKSTISKRNHKHLRNVVMTWKGHHTVKKKKWDSIEHWQQERRGSYP